MLVFVPLVLFIFWGGHWVGNTLSANVADVFLALLSVWTFFLTLFVAYQRPRVASRGGRHWVFSREVATALSSFFIIGLLFQERFIDRPLFVALCCLGVAAVVAAHFGLPAYLRGLVKRAGNERRVLIIGTGERARALTDMLRNHHRGGIHLVGYLAPFGAPHERSVPESQVLGSIEDIGVVLKHHIIDEVILAVPHTMLSAVERIAHGCEEEGVKFCLLADLFDLQIARAQVVECGQVRLLELEPIAQDEWKLFVKRVLDISVAALLLVLFAPVICLLAVAIKLDSPGPVFFVQERVGFKRRRFRMLKFRSMVENAEQLLGRIEHLNEAEGPIFKIANDPRITRVGRLLRRTSLDELPQLLHVFTGEMSLVGPRPMSVRDVDLFDKGIQRKRFSVKPGLTCLWQVSGRSNLPFSRWLELDLQYIEKWSLWLDCKILLRTFPAVLRGNGAL